MARAHSVWVLMKKSGEPSHGFTVKHELVSHMRRYPHAPETRTVFRLPDGGGPAGVVWSWPADQYLKENL